MAEQLPPSFLAQVRESGYRPGMNEEADALFNPSITARPLHVPMTGQILKRLNPETEFFWAFDRNGQSPNHERVERLRSVGFEYATTDDCLMAVEDVVKGRDKAKPSKDGKGFSNEIRNGDLRLMKVPKRRWLEIRKSQMLQAIMMSNPRGKAMGDDGAVMSAQSLVPGVQTQVTEEPIEAIRSRAVVSNVAQDLADKQIRGNATVVKADQVNKRS